MLQLRLNGRELPPPAQLADAAAMRAHVAPGEVVLATARLRGSGAGANGAIRAGDVVRAELAVLDTFGNETSLPSDLTAYAELLTPPGVAPHAPAGSSAAPSFRRAPAGRVVEWTRQLVPPAGSESMLELVVALSLIHI